MTEPKTKPEAVWIGAEIRGVQLRAQGASCVVCGESLRLAGAVLGWVRAGEDDPVPVVLHEVCADECEHAEGRKLSDAQNAAADKNKKSAEKALNAALESDGWRPRQAGVAAARDEALCMARKAESELAAAVQARDAAAAAGTAAEAARDQAAKAWAAAEKARAAAQKAAEGWKQRVDEWEPLLRELAGKNAGGGYIFMPGEGAAEGFQERVNAALAKLQ